MTVDDEHGAASMPLPSLRIGITGKRGLTAEHLAGLQKQVGAIFDAVAHSHPEVRIATISPLAEGADRLVAEVAIAKGSALSCPLPFAQAEYERDFEAPGSLDTFRQLLAQAHGRVFELDGARGAMEATSYGAVGKLVVRNCDLLIAIWDGERGDGAGGTADTVQFCAHHGPPVIWIDSLDSAAPRWIENADDLLPGAPVLPVEPRFGRYLCNLLEAPDFHHNASHALLHQAGRFVRWGIGHVRRHPAPPPSALEDFLRETPQRVWGPWKLYRQFMRLLTRRTIMPRRTPPRPATATIPPAPTEPADLTGPAEAAWLAHFAPTDARANEYAARYRSSYLWVFTLACIALISAAIAEAGPESRAWIAGVSIVEVVSLFITAWLIGREGARGWQRRFIEYRLLAELSRKQAALAPLAWAVPNSGQWATSKRPWRGLHRHPHPGKRIGPVRSHVIANGTSWVSWLFSAWLREVPLPQGTMTGDHLARIKAHVLRNLIRDQIAYHRARRRDFQMASQRLTRASEAVFVALSVLVLTKIWLLAHQTGSPLEDGWLHRVGLWAAVMPPLTAAFVGIKAYTELETQAEQSEQMLKVMRAAHAKISAIDAHAPLASMALGNALAQVSIAMLQDLEGWASLFRMKAVEA